MIGLLISTVKVYQKKSDCQLCPQFISNFKQIHRPEKNGEGKKEGEDHADPNGEVGGSGDAKAHAVDQIMHGIEFGDDGKRMGKH